ncbi:MAG: hypothetical protein GYB64_09460 [Chloroflexi bacterium]|nr:hypothetical protein [Chloroflexota bacterium]
MSLCSQVARTAEEPLIGTIKSLTRVWILLEFNGPWRAYATEDNDLPEVAQTWLLENLQAVPDARAQFIRSTPGTGPRLYVALPDDTDSVMFGWQLDSYEDLAAVDLAAVVESRSGPQVYEPLLAVCTNGKRDACCAKFGVRVAQQLHEDGRLPVWQTTHVTGHRWAATGVLFPHGIYYGRMDDDPLAVVEAAHAGEIAPDLYRGRSFHPKPVQVADALLRSKTGDFRWDAYRLQGASAVVDEAWEVIFTTRDEQRHRVQVAREPIGTMQPSDCSTPEATPVYDYWLRSHIVEPG